MKSIDIGKMDKRIILQKYDKESSKQQTNPKGFSPKDAGWSNLKTVWANVNNLFGREFWSAKAINEENTKNFIIRWSTDIADLNGKTYRIIYNNKQYDIDFVDNLEEANRFYKIKAKVVN